MQPPTTVLLPTTRWTEACADVADQLGPDDELLVVADDPADPVADREFPPGVELLFAGDPEGCSGKANAIATGMDAASNDRIVWTDDDFHHPPDWLAGLHESYERHGPTTELPFFVGQDPLAVFLEPTYAVGGTLGVWQGGTAWGGAVVFERDDLDWDGFLSDLRRTVSDDGLLSEYLDMTPARRTRLVPAGGSVRATLERHARFMQVVYRHEPRDTAGMVAVVGLVGAGCLLFPLYALVMLTLLHAAVYAAVGVRRWTFLLAYPAVISQVPLVCYGLARRTFVWGGRRYRWRSKFDVEVVD